MEASVNNLPPSKRFKLLNLQQDLFILPPPPSSCLPAKKRIWAPYPLSPTKLQHNPKLIEENPTKDNDKTIEGSPSKEKLREEEEEDDNAASLSTGADLSNPTIKEKTQDDDDDDGIICAVCLSTDADPSNPIVFCDGCNLKVHAFCYGNPLIQSIPDGEWFCQHCILKGEDQNSNCCLCPKKGGALKPTTDDKWAHIVCALFVPEVYFKDSEGREGIDCGRIIPKGRRGLECYLCGCRSGCGIECAEIGCGLRFHASCGVEERLSFELKEGRNGGGGIVAGFCGVHSEIWKKQQLTGKFKIVARETKPKRKAGD